MAGQLVAGGGRQKEGRRRRRHDAFGGKQVEPTAAPRWRLGFGGDLVHYTDSRGSLRLTNASVLGKQASSPLNKPSARLNERAEESGGVRRQENALPPVARGRNPSNATLYYAASIQLILISSTSKTRVPAGAPAGGFSP